jgi:hypothetical protein
MKFSQFFIAYSSLRNGISGAIVKALYLQDTHKRHGYMRIKSVWMGRLLSCQGWENLDAGIR